MRVDGQPFKEVNVEAAATRVTAGPSGLEDSGYAGWTIDSKIFLDS